VTAGPQQLVLLGGGHAHLHVLQDLARTPLASVRVVLVSPHGTLSYSGMVPGVVAGLYPPAACTIPLARLAASAGVTHRLRLAVGLDAAARRLWLDDGSNLHYDLLSVDTGGRQDPQALPGAAEHALFVRPLGAFVEQLATRLDRVGGEAPRWVVIGGGAAGFELAMALRHRPPPRPGRPCFVTLVAGGAPLLVGYPPGVVRRAERALSGAGVEVLRLRALAVGADAVEFPGGLLRGCDGCAIATGVTGPSWLAGSGLALDDQGFVRTGPTLQSVSHPDVLAAGDVATRVDVASPRSGVHAVRSGPALARNLRLLLAGGQPMPYLPPGRTLNLLSCGDRRAIVSYGGGAAEGRWAWCWKDRIDRAFVALHGGPASPQPFTRVA
jgi:pyridine nucleotide-disulfide oxidoreductase family protein